MGSKQAIEGATRGALLMIDPWELFLVGRDQREDGGVDGPEHPCYDERALGEPDEALVNSMVAVGFFGSIVFRNNGNRHEVVFGRRRTIAAREAARRLKEAGAPTFLIGATHRRGTDATVMEISVAENEIRRNDTPLLRAQKAARMLARGMDESSVARAFGIGLQPLRESLKLLDLSDEVLQKVEKKELSASAATALAVLPREAQAPALERAQKEKPGKKPSRKRVEAAVEGPKKSKKPSADEPHEYEQLAEAVRTGRVIPPPPPAEVVELQEVERKLEVEELKEALTETVRLLEEWENSSFLSPEKAATAWVVAGGLSDQVVRAIKGAKRLL